jgi:hypothetical protein
MSTSMHARHLKPPPPPPPPPLPPSTTANTTTTITTTITTIHHQPPTTTIHHQPPTTTGRAASPHFQGSFADVDTLLDATMKLRFAVATQKATGQPWFLGVGLRKPHLDWRIPQGFLDLCVLFSRFVFENIVKQEIENCVYRATIRASSL